MERNLTWHFDRSRLRRSAARRGSLLVCVMILSALIMIVVVPTLQYVSLMTKSTLRRRAGDQAFYAAESGIARTLSYIQAQPQGVFNSMFNVTKASGGYYPFGTNAQVVDVNRSDFTAGSSDVDSYVARVYTETVGGNKRYIVESTGLSTLALPAKLYRRVLVDILPATFARYAFFNSASLSTIDGQARWLGGGEEFFGPVHSNHNLYVGLNATSSNHLIFHSDVTIVRSDVVYSGTGPYIEYRGVKETNADYVELPNDLTNLKNAAASGGLNLPQDDPYYDPNEDSDPSNNVPVPPNNFLSGPINNYEFAFNGASVTVTNLFSGTSFVKSLDPGTFNGAIVVNQGNVFVHGTVDGQVTLAALGTQSATPTAYTSLSNGNVIVNGNLKYAGHPSGQDYAINPDLSQCDDVLGLIAERNFALDADSPANTVLDAHLMLTGQATPNPDVRTWNSLPAGQGQDGAFFIEDGNIVSSNRTQDLSYIWSGVHDSTGTDVNQYAKLGNLYLNGGVVHFMRGQTKYGTLYGFERHYSFDQRLNSNPPPYYPLTGDTIITSWEENRHVGGDSFTSW